MRAACTTAAAPRLPRLTGRSNAAARARLACRPSNSAAAVASQSLASPSVRRYARYATSSSSSSRSRATAASTNAAAASAAGNDDHAAANALLAAATAPVSEDYPPAVRAATVAGGHRGLVATRALREGEVVLAVPLVNALAVPEINGGSRKLAAALIEDWQDTHGIELPAALSKYLLASNGTDSTERLTAWLLWLLRRHKQGSGDGAAGGAAAPAAGGGRSLWDLYASMLPAPEECISFISFTDEEAEAWLFYSRWQDWQRSDAAARNTAAMAVLDVLARANAGPRQRGRPKRTTDAAAAAAKAEAAWAYGLVNLRTFSWRLTKGPNAKFDLMVPGADLVNHSPWPNAKFHFSRPARLFTVTATRAIEAGEEVTISYGDGPANDSLFANYGFVCAGNPYDHLRRPLRAGWSTPLAECLAAGSAVPSMRWEPRVGDEELPVVTAWHMRASPEMIVAAEPSLRESPSFWRRRSALTALGLMPPDADGAGDGGGGSSGDSRGRSAAEGLVALKLYPLLAKYRFLQWELGHAAWRLNEDFESGWGDPDRRAAAAAAVYEEALYVAECIDVCESELAARGEALALEFVLKKLDS